MSNIALIYWLSRLSSIVKLIEVAATLTSIVIGIGIFAYSVFIWFEEWDGDKVEEYKQKRKRFSRRIWIPILLWVAATLTPDTKEAMLIIAGGKTLDYVQADTSLQKIPYKATELILKKMDEYIDDAGDKMIKTNTKDSTIKK